LIVREEQSGDATALRALLTAAFQAQPIVADLVDALKAHPMPLPVRSFVAEEDGEVVGHVMLSASRLDAPRRLLPVYVLSPLSVRPDRQGRGIGTALIVHALAAAEVANEPLVFLEGDPAYYAKRGFVPAGPRGFRKPSLRIPDAAFQVAQLPAYESWMTGTLVYAEPFWALDCVGLRPDAH